MTNLRIKPVNHGSSKRDKNRYCGPAVISAITGITTGEAAAQLRAFSNRRMITGTGTWEVQNILLKNGIRMRDARLYWDVKFNRTDGVTLAGWLKASVKDRNAKRVFLIVAGWHWQLVQGRRYVCGRTKEIVSIRDKRVKRRARVAEVYELHAK
tara:strand:+ start:45 stop:506 length:462 start_codon:yes stop_codon:yes gene_type:complete